MDIPGSSVLCDGSVLSDDDCFHNVLSRSGVYNMSLDLIDLF